MTDIFVQPFSLFHKKKRYEDNLGCRKEQIFIFILVVHISFRILWNFVHPFFLKEKRTTNHKQFFMYFVYSNSISNRK